MSSTRPLDDVTLSQVEFLALRGVFVECLRGLLRGGTIPADEIHRAIDRLMGHIESRALALGADGDPIMSAQAMKSVEAFRSDLFHGFDDLNPGIPQSEPEVTESRIRRPKAPQQLPQHTATDNEGNDHVWP